jgi:hypothetical protein
MVSIDLAIKLRRQGRFAEAISVLHPVLFPQGRLRPVSGFNEEYALNLAQLGAPERAEAFLKNLTPASEKDAANRAFALGCTQVMQWKHREGGQSLWLAHTMYPADHYFRWVSFVNWVWCLLYQGSAIEIVQSSRDWMGALEPFPVLKTNLGLCIRKAALITGNHDVSFDIDSGCELSPYDELVKQMLNWLSQLVHRVGSQYELTLAAKALRQSARANALWELDREMALWIELFGLGNPSEEDALQSCSALLWANPFAGVHSFLNSLTGATGIASLADPSSLSVLRSFEGASEVSLYLGRNAETRLAMSPESAVSLDDLAQDGSLPSSFVTLLNVLSSDVFRPHSAAKLSYDLSGSLSYHPESDNKRVRVAIVRLKQRLKDLDFDWEIHSVRGHGYSLLCRSPGIRIKMPVQERAATGQKSHLRSKLGLEDLIRHFGSERFSRLDLQSRLKISERSAIRWIDGWLKSGEVCREGTGSQTMYVISKRG